ncbi:MAG: transglycosylase domain-containing protein [Saprospiraceae bacterium]|nr:transglycosylase domain-containing protein [Candidatus Brachybacter algidus]
MILSGKWRIRNGKQPLRDLCLNFTLKELFWSRARMLLQMSYSKVVEFGDGIYGIEAACATYYGENVLPMKLNQVKQPCF